MNSEDNKMTFQKVRTIKNGCGLFLYFKIHFKILGEFSFLQQVFLAESCNIFCSETTINTAVGNH